MSPAAIVNVDEDTRLKDNLPLTVNARHAAVVVPTTTVCGPRITTWVADEGRTPPHVFVLDQGPDVTLSKALAKDGKTAAKIINNFKRFMLLSVYSKPRIFHRRTPRVSVISAPVFQRTLKCRGREGAFDDPFSPRPDVVIVNPCAPVNVTGAVTKPVWAGVKRTTTSWLCPAGKE
jgi:hypothetical protein